MENEGDDAFASILLSLVIERKKRRTYWEIECNQMQRSYGRAFTRSLRVFGDRFVRGNRLETMAIHRASFFTSSGFFTRNEHL